MAYLPERFFGNLVFDLWTRMFFTGCIVIVRALVVGYRCMSHLYHLKLYFTSFFIDQVEVINSFYLVG